MKSKITLATIIIIHIFLLSIHIFLLSRLVFFPYPEVFIYPYLANHGFLPYANIFDQHFPGLLMLPINFASLGLGGPMEAKMWLFASVAFSQILIYLTVVRLTKSKLLGFLANIFYLFTQVLFEGYIFWVDSLLAPILLLAFLLLASSEDLKRQKYVLLSGFTLGLAVLMKQTFITIPVFLAMYYLFFQKVRKRIVPFCVGFCIPIAALLVWIVGKGILSEFVYWTFIFNFTVYAPMARKLPTLSQMIRVAVFFSPILYLFFAKNKKFLLLLALFLVFAAIPAFSRFEFVHFQPAIPFAVIFFALMISEFGLHYHCEQSAHLAARQEAISNFGSKKGLLRPPCREAGHFQLLAMTTVIGISVTILVWFPAYIRNHLGNKIYFFDSDTIDTSQIVKNNTKSSDKIFVLGAQPIIYYLSGRLPPGNVFTVNLPWNMAVSEGRILNGLTSDPPIIVVRNKEASIDNQKVVDFSSRINLFIDENFVQFSQVGENEVLIRKPQSGLE